MKAELYINTLKMMHTGKLIIFFCLCTLSSTLTAKHGSNTYLDVLRDSMSNRGVMDKAKFAKSSLRNADVLSILKLFHNIENDIPKFLDLRLNHTDETIFSNEDELFSIFGVGGLGQKLFSNSSTCVNDTGRLVVGLLRKENWAIQFFDATGKPGPSLTQGRLNFIGNYDQCVAASAPLQLLTGGKSAYKFHGGYFKVGLKWKSLPILIQVGLCLPDTCSEEQVTSFGSDISRMTNGSIKVAFAYHLTNDTRITTTTIIAIVISSVIGLMMFLGTLFDLIFIQCSWRHQGNLDINTENGTVSPKDSSAKNGDIVMNVGENNVSYPGTSRSKTKQSNTEGLNGVAANILISFSIYSNSKKILNVSQTPGSIESIHGIRFLSISWVVLGHTYFFSRAYGINLVTAFPEYFHRWTFDAIINALVSVDTFFTLSGLLTSYLTIGQLLKNGPKLNWPLFYFHRFWRLTPPYMLSILLYLGFLQYFEKGPLRSNQQPSDKSFCEKNWWTNLLYINNLVGVDEMCFGHSWYLANDMQFFVLSPLMIVPFYFHRFAGVCSCLIFLLASWITTGVSSTLEKWPPTGLGLNTLENQAIGLGNLDFFHHYYLTPWCRIGPFVVGVLAGYILAIKKGKPFYMKWWVVALGWITAAASALAVLYGLKGDITGDAPSSVGAAALYNSVSRSVWGACVCWVIIACTAGYGGPVNALLSWSPFVVLGRLTYMVYLLHIPVISIFYQNLDQLFYMNDTTMSIYFLGLLVASNLVAFVAMLGLESPMIGLERAFLKRNKK